MSDLGTAAAGSLSCLSNNSSSDDTITRPIILDDYFRRSIESTTMEGPDGHLGQEEMLNYINTSSHKVNLKAALDYHSVREPDMELVSVEGRKLYGHRSAH